MHAHAWAPSQVIGHGTHAALTDMMDAHTVLHGRTERVSYAFKGTKITRVAQMLCSMTASLIATSFSRRRCARAQRHDILDWFQLGTDLRLLKFAWPASLATTGNRALF
eukprot:6129167-Pleurochrysis_carterae.AAC.1